VENECGPHSDESKSATGSIVRRASLQVWGGNARCKNCQRSGW
jgi:hypothetical protein